MKSSRPMHLNLFQIRFPIMAIISILHRISGVLIFLALPILLCLLSHSLSAQSGFSDTLQLCHSGFCKLFLWLVLVAVIYHLIAGCRHLIMDIGVGESIGAARFTAIFVLALVLILAIAAGVWIW